MLLTALICTTSFSVSASPVFSENVASLLAELKIMQGDPDGNLRLYDLVSRAECTKIAVASSTYRDTVASGSKTSPFKDLPSSHWAAPYVTVAVRNGLCKGYLDATFRPTNTVTYEEALTMFLRVLGYSEQDFGTSWPDGQIGIAQNIGLCDGLAKSKGEALSRRDMMIIVYNMLNTPAKGASVDYLSEFDRSITDDVVLIASGIEDSAVGAGKVVTSAGTYKVTESFDYSNIGKRGSISIRNNDTIVSFIPNEQYVDEYTVTDTVGNDIFYGNSILDVSDDTLVYYKSKSYTYGAMASQVDSGDVCMVFKDAYGSVDYIVFSSKGSSASLSDKTTEKHVVYSILGDGVITYKSGSFDQIKFTAGTLFYEDDEPTSYSAIAQKIEMGDVLNIKYKDSGAIDYVVYTEGGTTGPVTVSGSDWYKEFGAAAMSAAVMRDGTKAEPSEVQINDIAYYLKDLNMFVVYSKKVTGVYESASPNKDIPSSVTVSGVSYTIESVEAFKKLSSTGDFAYGDTVTLLLGKNGEIADVASQAQTSASEVFGYLIETGRKSTTVNGTSVTKPYARIILPSGESCEYITSKEYDSILNSIVKADFDNGTAKLTVIPPQSGISGRFSWISASGVIGNNELARDVEIIEVSTTEATEAGMAAVVFPSRLNKMNLSYSDILYAGKDSSGKINKLILKDVTGDMHSYGIITSASNRSFGMSVSGSYSYLVGGTEKSISTSNTMYKISKGQAAQIKIASNGSVNGISPLTKTADGSGAVISGNVITINGESYTMSASADIYVKDSSYNYSMLTADELNSGREKYNVALYSDKLEALGGRVRIVVATKK